MLYSNLFKAIRAKCLDCCCGSSNEVEKCPADDCPLYPYRFGNELSLFTDSGTSTKSEKHKPKPYPIHFE